MWDVPQPGSTRRLKTSAPSGSIARGGRVVFDRKDPITREPYFERDGGGSDGDEGDENERTPVASIRV